MFSKPTCPVPDGDRAWIIDRARWLREQYGDAVLASVETIVPSRQYFADRYDASLGAIEDLFQRTCRYMRVDQERIRIGFYRDRSSWMAGMAHLILEGTKAGAGGCFLGQDDDGKLLIGIAEDQVSDAAALVAVLAHELAHVHLLGDRRLTGTEPDHEHVTDLLTVALGLGVFTATACFQFRQWRQGGWQGWTAKRLGYLTEEQFGYALALFAWLRSEKKPKWAAQYLPEGVYAFFKASERHLDTYPPPGWARL